MLSQSLIHEFVRKQCGNVCVQFEVSLSNKHAKINKCIQFAVY